MLTILIESAFRSCVLAASLWAIFALLRVHNPHIRRVGWIAVVIASCAMPLLMKIGVVSMPTAIIGTWELAPIAAVAATTNNNWGVLSLIYFLVCAGLLARLMLGIVQTWRLTQNAQPVLELGVAGHNVRFTAAVRSPVTFASTILLPIDWSTWAPVKRQAVLAHERAHVRQRDFYVQILAQTHRAIFWFNPLAWWVVKELSDLGEAISDDAAINEIEDRTAYATVLLEVASTAHPVPLAVAMAKASTVVARIERTLTETTQFKAPSRIAKLALVLSLTPMIALAAGGTATNAQLSSISRVALIKQPIKTDVVIVAPRAPSTGLTQPAYPLAEKQAEHQGTVMVDTYVGKDGRVLEARVKQSSGFSALDEAAVSEAQTWQFIPATGNGTPIAMWVTVPVAFKLLATSMKLDEALTPPGVNPSVKK